MIIWFEISGLSLIDALTVLTGVDDFMTWMLVVKGIIFKFVSIIQSNKTMSFPKQLVFLFGCILFTMAGCGGDRVSQALDRAEAIKDDYADSALAILDSIAVDDIEGDGSKARYALLKTYIKANLRQLEAADSSLIDIAVDYYNKKKMADEAVIAYFYKADIMYDAGDYEDAMRYALNSLEYNEKANNLRFQAKTYELMAYIYSHASNYPQSIFYSRKAAAIFKSLGLHNNEFYSLLSEARSYSQDDTTENVAVELLDSLRDNFRDVDSTALGYLHYRYVYPLYLLGRHHEGYEHYRKALSYWKGEDRLESKPLVADMFTNIGMYDSAAYYLEQERLINPDYDNDATYHFALRNLADSLGDIPLFYKEVMTFSELERADVRAAMRDEVSLIERDFEHDRAERARVRSVTIKLIAIFFVVLMAMAGIFTFFLIRQRHHLRVLELQKKEAATRKEKEELEIKEAATRKEKEELEIKEAATRKEKEELEIKEAATRKEKEKLEIKEAATRKEKEELQKKEAETRRVNEELQCREVQTRKEMEELRQQLQSGMEEAEELKKLLSATDDIKIRQPLQALDAIYEGYFRMKDMDDSQVGYGQLLERFNKEIEKMRSPEYVGHLESVLDGRCDYFLSQLRGLKKRPNDRDMKMLTYVLAGFSPRVIALLCDMKLTNYNLRYSRMKSSLRKYAPDVHERLTHLARLASSGRLLSRPGLNAK